jgi:hypothetical protein
LRKFDGRGRRTGGDEVIREILRRGVREFFFGKRIIRPSLRIDLGRRDFAEGSGGLRTSFLGRRFVEVMRLFASKKAVSSDLGNEFGVRRSLLRLLFSREKASASLSGRWERLFRLGWIDDASDNVH